MTGYEQEFRDLRAGVEALRAEWSGRADRARRGRFENAATAEAGRCADRLAALLASSAPATASEGATEKVCCWCRPGSPELPVTTWHFKNERCTRMTESRADGLVPATGVKSSDGGRGLSEEVTEKWTSASMAARKAEHHFAAGCLAEAVQVVRHLTEQLDLLAARAAQPEGVERVEWIVRDARCSWQPIHVRSEQEGREYLAQFAGKLYRRTVTEYAPVVGPWEVVGDE